MLHIPRRTLLTGLAALASASAAPAWAHGPTRQKVSQTVDIARTPAQVWAVCGDFDSISRWHPAIASSPARQGNAVGSRRTLTLRQEGEPEINEDLVKYDPEARLYQYRIEKVDPKVLPVNNYSAWFEVKDGPDGGSAVEWRAAFYRGYMLNDPPPELNDAASSKAVVAVFRAGLDGLKALAERA